MRKLIFSLLAVVLFASCTDKNAYTITGTVTGRAESPDSTKVYLYEDRKGENVLDSAMLIGGKFELKGTQKEASIGYIGMLLAERFPLNLPVILEPGAINIGIDDRISVSGSPLNDKLQAHENVIRDIYENLNKMSEDAAGLAEDDPIVQDLQAKFEEGQNKIVEQSFLFTKENIGNALGLYYFTSNHFMFNGDQKQELIDLLPEAAKVDESVADILKQTQTLQVTAIGKKFADVSGLTIEGKDASLSDYAGKGKVVLIDFWASWCGPCIREMPHVKEAYAKYKNKGFEIVGISLDESQEAWQGATENLKIDWPQFSNLKGWDEPAAKSYGVNSIPHTVLLDKEGVIIAKDLRGQALSDKLEELLK